MVFTSYDPVWNFVQIWTFRTKFWFKRYVYIGISCFYHFLFRISSTFSIKLINILNFSLSLSLSPPPPPLGQGLWLSTKILNQKNYLHISDEMKGTKQEQEKYIHHKDPFSFSHFVIWKGKKVITYFYHFFRLNYKLKFLTLLKI